MSLPAPESFDRLDDQQIDFYLAEYQRVLGMFDGYSSKAAGDLRRRLAATMERLRREARRRQGEAHTGTGSV